MPKIPSIADTGLGEGPQPTLAVAQVNPTSGAEGAIGQALTNAGGELQSASAQVLTAYKQEEEKTDTIKVEDAWNKYRTKAMEMTAGPNGVLATKGADAVNGNLLNRTMGGLRDTRKQILEGLNPRQQERFDQRADVTDLATAHQVLEHLTIQQNQYSETTFEGSKAAARSQVSAAPTDPGVFKGAYDTLMSQADTHFKLNGITDKATQDKQKNELSDSLWKARIDTLLYDKPALADALFRANEKEIKDPELRLLLQSKTREAAQTVTAANEAQSIIDSTRGELAAAIPPGAATQADQPARAMPVGNTQPPNWNAGGNVEKQRAYDALRVLHDELDRPQSDADRAGLQREMKAQERRIAQQWGQNAVPTAGDQDTTPASMQVNPQIAPATSGLPNSRDVAAQLPVMMGKVNKRADELYGPDTNNPDRAAFVKRLTSEVQARVSADVTQLNAIQREAQGKLIDAVAGIRTPGAANGMVATGGQAAPAAPKPITSFAEIQQNPELMRAWQMLDPTAKVSLQNLMEHNLRADDKGDNQLYRDLFNQINAGKIHFYNQITVPEIANRLSMEQIGKLRSEIDRWSPPGGKPWAELQKFGDTRAENYFKTNIFFTAQPSRINDATNRWNDAAQTKIDEYTKASKDVRTLFMGTTPDSLISSQYLDTFVNSTPATGLAEGAAAVKQGSTPANIVRAPATIKTPADAEAWIKTLPPEATMFVDPAGQVRVIPGRQPGSQPAPAAQPANATPAQNDAPPPAINIDQMNQQGKLVTPQPAAAPTAPAGPLTADRFEVIDTPDNVSDNLAVMKAAREAARSRKQLEMDARNPDLLLALKRAIEAVGGTMRGLGTALQGKIPTELERVYSGFEAIKQAGRVSRGDEDVLRQALKYGLLPPADEQLAKGLLDRLGKKK